MEDSTKRPIKQSRPITEPPTEGVPLGDLLSPQALEARRVLTSWRGRMIVELLIGVGVLIALGITGAPGWSYVLATYIGTRVARLDQSADNAALQSSYVGRFRAIENNGGRIIDRLDKWKMGGGV